MGNFEIDIFCESDKEIVEKTKINIIKRRIAY
jgi:hypothetical protein